MRPSMIGPEAALVAVGLLFVPGCGGRIRPDVDDMRLAAAGRSDGARAGTPTPHAGTPGPRDRRADRPTVTPSASGVGVTVYLVDSGIHQGHQEFAGGRASVGGDFVGAGRGGQDCNGHGTHVAGLVGGATYGVAPGVRLVALRVADCRGRVDDAALLAALAWVADPARVRRPAVLTLSLAADIGVMPRHVLAALEAAVRRVLASGVTVVAAAGNHASDACGYTPARIASVITVSAVVRGPGAGRAALRPARLPVANFGRCVDFFAPGGPTRSAWWTGEEARRTDIGGTSAAAATAAGAAALYLSCHPRALPEEVARALLGPAIPGAVTHVGLGSPERRLRSPADVIGTANAACPAPRIARSPG